MIDPRQLVPLLEQLSRLAHQSLRQHGPGWELLPGTEEGVLTGYLRREPAGKEGWWCPCDPGAILDVAATLAPGAGAAWEQQQDRTWCSAQLPAVLQHAGGHAAEGAALGRLKVALRLLVQVAPATSPAGGG